MSRGRSSSAQGSAEPFVPDSRDPGVLRAAAEGCRGCDLWKNATQTVFGEGPRRASIVLVGEQPGDREDRIGRPFVGPAGSVLTDALSQAGVDHDAVYMTNAVKHFKWKARGKRRIHDRPARWQIMACKPWLLAELRALQPDLIVALGAVAAESLFGPGVRVTEQRGSEIPGPDGIPVLITVHPASILRGPHAQREALQAAFVDDLKTIPAALRGRRKAAAR